MASNWIKQKSWSSEDECLDAIPDDWEARQVESIYTQQDIGRRYDKKSTKSAGATPVVDQSADGFIGWHDSEPGVVATAEDPVVTFANHTCEMRLVRHPFSVIQNVFPLKGKTGDCDTRYLYYSTKGIVRLEEYKGHYPQFRERWIGLPPLSEQKAIAHILGTLDDKIELNRKTNETLEAVAKALFKSWFVDFDPVRAKAEGRPTGLPSEISDLFPDSFEDSELGEIPSGWKISNLDDFIHLDSGLPYKGLLKGTGEAHLLTMGCADRALRFKSDGVHSYPSPIPERHLVNPGDIIICSHDLTQAREQLGAPFIVPDNLAGCIAAATNTFIVRQKSPGTTEYLYQVFRGNGFREQMIASAKGSVILHISKESVLDYSFASPELNRLISAYQSATDGMTRKIQEFGNSIYTLTTIRDALLPKLISGEIRIPDAEKMLEEVGV